MSSAHLVAAGTIIGAVASLLLVVVTMRLYVVGEHQRDVIWWQKIEMSITFLGRWDSSEMTALREDAKEFYDFENMTPIDLEAVRKHKEYRRISNTFTTILNYLDDLALYCNLNALDDEICFLSMVFVVANYEKVLRPFIEFTRATSDPKDAPLKAWGHLEHLARRWGAVLRSGTAEMEKHLDSWYDQTLVGWFPHPPSYVKHAKHSYLRLRPFWRDLPQSDGRRRP